MIGDELVFVYFVKFVGIMIVVVGLDIGVDCEVGFVGGFIGVVEVDL